MILTNEHIGKKVKDSTGTHTLLALHGNHVWLLGEDGKRHTYGNYDWELVPEEKIPSAIIADFLGIASYTDLRSITLDRFIYAVCRFLDEEFKGRKK